MITAVDAGIVAAARAVVTSANATASAAAVIVTPLLDGCCYHCFPSQPRTAAAAGHLSCFFVAVANTSSIAVCLQMLPLLLLLLQLVVWSFDKM